MIEIWHGICFALGVGLGFAVLGYIDRHFSASSKK
jgi:hypothetical protein